MEAGALSYRIISAGAMKYRNLVVPGRTEHVPSIVMQFAVWLSYKTDFVSVMTTLCVKFSAGDGLYPTGLFVRISEPWSLDSMEVEQSVLAVELEPTDHVCVLYLLWTSLVFCIYVIMPSGP